MWFFYVCVCINELSFFFFIMPHLDSSLSLWPLRQTSFMPSPPPDTVDILSIFKLPWHHQLSTARMASCLNGKHSLTNTPSLFSFVPLDATHCSELIFSLSFFPTFTSLSFLLSFLLPLIFLVLSSSSLISSYSSIAPPSAHHSLTLAVLVIITYSSLRDSLVHLSSSPCSFFFFYKPLILM